MVYASRLLPHIPPCAQNTTTRISHIKSKSLPSMLLARATTPSLRMAVRPRFSTPRVIASYPSDIRRAFSSSVSRLEIKTRYTPEHEWVTLDTETNIGTVGITEYAQKSLGDVVYVELPSEGSEVKQGGEYAA